MMRTSLSRASTLRVNNALPAVASRSFSTEFFPGIPKIQYDPSSKPTDLTFKYYNADEVLMGKTMEDWCRFSVVWWHTFRWGGQDPFGMPTLNHPWDDGGNSVDNAKVRVDAAFEFFTKLGVKHYAFHDIDIAPEGSTLAESEKMLHAVCDHALEQQKATGVGLLWATQNLFSHPRFMNGGATNPNLDCYAYACAKTKMAIDVGQKLGGENHVFWGGREGYQTILNTNMKKELDNLAAFFHMVVDYKKDIGYDAQCLIEPKPREPTKHQYDYDAATVMGFLSHYGLSDTFKLNIEPNHTTLAGHDYEHDLMIGSKYGMLGSVDCNTGDPLVGWDTDQFAMDIKKTTLAMEIVIAQGGLAPGGLNFDCKVRRESSDLEDYFIAHVGGMDAFARGLRNAVKIAEDGILPGMVTERYATFEKPLGKKVAAGDATLVEMSEYAASIGEAPQISGKQELYEVIHTEYC